MAQEKIALDVEAFEEMSSRELQAYIDSLTPSAVAGNSDHWSAARAGVDGVAERVRAAVEGVPGAEFRGRFPDAVRDGHERFLSGARGFGASLDGPGGRLQAAAPQFADLRTRFAAAGGWGRELQIPAITEMRLTSARLAALMETFYVPTVEHASTVPRLPGPAASGHGADAPADPPAHEVPVDRRSAAAGGAAPLVGTAGAPEPDAGTVEPVAPGVSRRPDSGSAPGAEGRPVTAAGVGSATAGAGTAAGEGAAGGVGDGSGPARGLHGGGTGARPSSGTPVAPGPYAEQGGGGDRGRYGHVPSGASGRGGRPASRGSTQGVPAAARSGQGEPVPGRRVQGGGPAAHAGAGEPAAVRPRAQQTGPGGAPGTGQTAGHSGPGAGRRGVGPGMVGASGRGAGRGRGGGHEAAGFLTSVGNGEELIGDLGHVVHPVLGGEGDP